MVGSSADQRWAGPPRAVRAGSSADRSYRRALAQASRNQTCIWPSSLLHHA